MNISKSTIVILFLQIIIVMLFTAPTIGTVREVSVITFWEWLWVVLGYIFVTSLMFIFGYLEGREQNKEE